MSGDWTAAIREQPDNEAHWDAWFMEIYPRVLFLTARQAAGDFELAEEATQGAIERFLRYRAIERVESDRAAVMYLVRTARRLMIDERRRRERELPMPEKTLEKAVLATSVEQDDDVRSLLRHLARKEREILELVLGGYSVREIAEKLGMRYSTVGMRILRAKARLKDRLREA